MSKSIFDDDRLPNVSVEINHDAMTITFTSIDTDDSKTLGFNEDYDEYGLCTIDNLAFNFRILLEDGLIIFIYPIIDEDNDCLFNALAIPSVTEIGQIEN
ncbi:hypothetical protein VCHA53O466_140082 [Vibrio chagasii]|nr:hypothetical protein VCHA53O466_140082 [Vibrio chagasii]